jgi:hypothetical protein
MEAAAERVEWLQPFAAQLMVVFSAYASVLVMPTAAVGVSAKALKSDKEAAAAIYR